MIRPLKKRSPAKALIDDSLREEVECKNLDRIDYLSFNSLLTGLSLKTSFLFKNPIKTITTPIFLKKIKEDVYAVTPRSHKYASILNGAVAATSGIIAVVGEFNSVAVNLTLLAMIGGGVLKSVFHAAAGSRMRHNAGFEGYKVEDTRRKSDKSVTDSPIGHGQSTPVAMVPK